MNDNNSFLGIDMTNIPKPILRRSQARVYTNEEVQNYDLNIPNNLDNFLNDIIEKTKEKVDTFVTYCDANNQSNSVHSLTPLLPIMKLEDYITGFIGDKTSSPRKNDEKNKQTGNPMLSKPVLKRHQTY